MTGKLRSDAQTDAYFAGYFDGEGCITLHKRGPGVMPRIRITVKSANLPCLLAMKTRFGGTVILSSPPCPRRKSQYRWRIGSMQDCLAFIVAVEQYSIEKREQLTLAREWLEHRAEIPLRGRRSPETRCMAHEIQAAIAAQKHLDFFTLALEGDQVVNPPIRVPTEGKKVYSDHDDFCHPTNAYR